MKTLPLIIRQILVILVIMLVFTAGILLVLGEFTESIAIVSWILIKILGIVLLVGTYRMFRDVFLERT